MKLSLSLVAAFALVSLSSEALAYPTSVVFSPSGETKTLGNIGLLGYTSTNLGPTLSPGSSWFGFQVGVLPAIPYGNSGVSFGGLEIGGDVITPYGPVVKPVFNAKLGLLTEGAWSPSVSVGLMEVTPALPSMTFTYMSSTKRLKFGSGPNLGRLTLGFGAGLGARSQVNGTFPFPDSRALLMAAYESPMAWNRVGLMIDHLGGVSEISSTYIGPTVTLTDEVSVAAGAFLSNDRDTPYDGVFGMITVGFDARKP